MLIDQMIPAELTAITVRVNGGLGNQLFQYAAARSLALDRRTKLVLDRSFYDKRRHRSYELDKLGICGDCLVPVHGYRWVHSLRKLGRRVFRLDAAEYFEPHFHFDPKLQSIEVPCILNGYFQSPRYFQHHADTIRRELRPPEATDEESRRLAGILEDADSISLHVRRGDYVTNAKARQVFAECGQDYYLRALDRIPNGGPVVVFSDDITWAQQHLPTTRKLIFSGQANDTKRRSGLEDLWLMTKAEHHIIANSTFSWWGAWLAEKQNGTKIAPDRWFCESREKSADLIPDEWIRL